MIDDQAMFSNWYSFVKVNSKNYLADLGKNEVWPSLVANLDQ
jgi:hypothetical protein